MQLDFAGSGAQAATLAGAALETAGIRLQSDMLDFVTSQSGQTLAGLIFLIAIAGAMITFASGGNYKWARYLLVGPPLFFFLTNVRVASDGAEWQFADRSHPKEALDQVLRGVAGFNGGERGGSDVAMVFQVWNVLVSEGIQYLIGLLELTSSDSDLNFMAKTERYMNYWMYTHISDRETRILIHAAMINKCAQYYLLQKDIADINIPEPVKNKKRAQLAKIQNKTAYYLERNAEDELSKWLLWGGPWEDENGNPLPKGENALQPGSYTCQGIWNATVDLLRPYAEDQIKLILEQNRPEQQSWQSSLDTFSQMIMKVVNRATGVIETQERDELRAAVEEYIAKALFQEIQQNNPYLAYLGMEKHSGLYQTGIGTGPGGMSEIATTSNSIQQFNQTEKYQYKGDFVNGALSLPYIQGVLVLLLAASYPFFAMIIIFPGRSGAMLTWLGLWLWVKSWDLGFAVVMMIDNMLYGLFPRGPGLDVDEVYDAGSAWVKIFEQDPTYSANTYYNLIATCLYAIPVVTFMAVRRGGSELLSASHGAWTSYATRLGSSPAIFQRSMQAQTYGRNVALRRFAVGATAPLRAMLNNEKVKQHFQGWLSTYREEGLASAERFARSIVGSKTDPNFMSLRNAHLQAERNNHVANMLQEISAHTINDVYRSTSDSFSSYMSESATAAKYFSHDFADSQHPGGEIFNSAMASYHFDREGIWNSIINSGMNAAKGAGNDVESLGKAATGQGGATKWLRDMFYGGSSGR